MKGRRIKRLPPIELHNARKDCEPMLGRCFSCNSLERGCHTFLLQELGPTLQRKAKAQRVEGSRLYICPSCEF